MTKIKIKFAGVNYNGYNCYVTEKGTYLADMDGNLYTLNQNPEYGMTGIDGECNYPVKKEQFEIVESFNNENNENN